MWMKPLLATGCPGSSSLSQEEQLDVVNTIRTVADAEVLTGLDEITAIRSFRAPVSAI
jgi:hypothetical protein